MKNAITAAVLMLTLCGVACNRPTEAPVGQDNRPERQDSVSTVWRDSVRWKADSLVGDFRVYEKDTPNVSEGRNKMKGVVLHHTATADAEEAFSKLTTPGSGVSCHVLIDEDGTRYVIANPEKITWHAGRSRFKGMDGANNFTLGIEFQGNTVDRPLTDLQIRSAIEYLLPVMKKYGLTAADVTTHEKIRADWKKSNPESDIPDKVDVTQEEYARFIKALEKRLP